MGKKRELTQDEIWDDSALVRSWDEAVEEYKVFVVCHPGEP
jgi:survival motor neuron SMN-like protein